MSNFIDFLLSGSILLLAFLALTNPNKVNIKGNLWFGLFLLCIFSATLESFFYENNDSFKNNLLINIIGLPAYFLAPIFYLSILHYIKPNLVWDKKHNLHFLSGIIFSVLVILLLINFKNSENIQSSNKSLIELYQYISYFFLGIFPFQLIIYSFLTYKKLKNHQKNIKIFSSNTENIDLKWLENIVIIICLLLFIWILDIVFNISTAKFQLINSFLLIGIYFIAYHFIKQKEIYPFSKIEQNEIIEIIEEFDVIDVKKKLIDDDKLESQKIDLLNLIQSKKPYLDSEISLIKLASEMNCTPHQLSYIINNGFDENFYQFINRFRIEEAKKLILNPNMNHLSLLGIGFEVGFNSKSVFNTTFKKNTGKTPSEFKKITQNIEFQ